MSLADLLLAEHSRAQTDRIIAWVGQSQARFDELFTFFAGDDQTLAQRAGWALSYLVIAKPGFISRHWKRLLQNLEPLESTKRNRENGSTKGLIGGPLTNEPLAAKTSTRHPAIKRNTLRLLQHVTIPSKYKGEVMSHCFDIITSPLEKPAAKAFSLTVLENMLNEYPEIGPELKLIIESQWEYESKAFQSRARKALKRLELDLNIRSC